VKVSEIPRSLHKVLVKIMANDDLDFYDPCEKAAYLLDQNVRIFQEKVEAKANSLYKSRHMRELNKSIKTLSVREREDAYVQGHQKGLNEGEAKGRDAGFLEAALGAYAMGWKCGYFEGSFRWKFPCKNAAG